jgi:hypothetical protein
MKAWTDYPFPELGDTPCMEAPIRECRVISYDWNKYCVIEIGGQELTVKIGYVYRKPGRCGEVSMIDRFKTKRSDGEYYWKHHTHRSKKTAWSVCSATDEWYDFETKREAIKKLMKLPDFSKLYCDGNSNGRSWMRCILEKMPVVPYRMKRRY